MPGPRLMISVPIYAVLVHKSAVGRGSAAIAVCQAMRCDTGMPSRVIRLSPEQATRASVFWRGRVRARRPRPMMVLYRNTAVSIAWIVEFLECVTAAAITALQELNRLLEAEKKGRMLGQTARSRLPQAVD